MIRRHQSRCPPAQAGCFAIWGFAINSRVIAEEFFWGVIMQISLALEVLKSILVKSLDLYPTHELSILAHVSSANLSVSL